MSLIKCIEYSNKSNIEQLFEYGQIVYYSRVFNILYLETDIEDTKLLSLNGIIRVNGSVKGKLLND